MQEELTPPSARETYQVPSKVLPVRKKTRPQFFLLLLFYFFFNKKSLTAIWAPLDHHLRSAPLCRPFSIMTTTTSSSSTTAGNVSYSAIQDEPQRLVQGFSFISAGTFHNCKLNFNVRLPGSSFKQNL